MGTHLAISSVFWEEQVLLQVPLQQDLEQREDHHQLLQRQGISYNIDMLCINFVLYIFFFLLLFNFLKNWIFFA